MMVLSVLSLSAQTPKYGKTYNPGHQHAAAHVEAQMPIATMSSTSSDLVSSGSMLPQAAVTGTTTTYDTPANTRPGQIHRDPGVIGEPEDDDEQPIGDAMNPLMLLACAYLGMRVFLKRKRA